MTALALVLQPLDPRSSQPLYQQVQRVLSDANEKRTDFSLSEEKRATGPRTACS